MHTWRADFAATNDTDVIKEVRVFVANGYRNETWASVDLIDGKSYTARNVRGQAVGQTFSML